MDFKTKDKDMIKELAHLLRENGDKILNGHAKLSLTTISLAQLNRGFTQICDVDPHEHSFEVLHPQNHATRDFLADLQFLHDFMQKSQRLKIIHSTSTIQGSIKIQNFRALHTLEIKKVPIHLLEGLSQLRGKLTTLICSRCISQLQDLFETCGGDMSSALSWTKLTTAILSFNNITGLDDSLRLLPSLQVLNLSHNAIRKTKKSLEYLPDLQHINLGYNQLGKIPTFDMAVNNRLQTLILKNNNLEKLNGIENLPNLVELDVADNCLYDHRQLGPLRELHRLRYLHLDGNPLAYHPKHQILTVKYLSAEVAMTLELDGKLIKHFEGVKTSFSQPNSPQMTRPDSRNEIPNLEASQTSINYSFEQSGEIARSITPSKSKKGRGTPTMKRKTTKKSLLSEFDSAIDTGTSSKENSRANTPVQKHEYLEYRSMIENTRTTMGPHWLQSLTPQPQDEPIEQDTVDHATKPANGHIENDQPITKPVTNGLGENDHAKQGNNECDRIVENDMCVNKDTDLVNSREDDTVEIHSNGHTEAGIEVKKKDSEPEIIYGIRRFESSDHQEITGESEPFLVQHLGCELIYLMVTVSDRFINEKDTTEGHIVEQLDLKCIETVQILNSQSDLKGDAGSIKSGQSTDGDEDNTHVVTQLVNGLLVLDPHMSSPQMSVDTFPPLVPINQPECIVGKNENRDSDDNTSRKSRSNSTNDDQTSTGSGSNGKGPVVKLTFSYVKKDKRKRFYVMESQEQAESFVNLLQPTLDEKQLAEKFKDRFQCLKCGTEFNKSEAPREVRRHSVAGNKGEMDAYSSSASSLGKDFLHEIAVCPSCKSEHIIELHIDLSRIIGKSRGSSAANSVGSFSSLSEFKPGATSSAKATPHKNKHKENGSLRNSYTESSSERNQTASIVSVIERLPSNQDEEYDNHPSSVSPRVFKGPKGTKKLKKSQSSPLFRQTYDTEFINEKKSTRLDTNDGSASSTSSKDSGKESFRSRLESTESDITVISNPSVSSITVLGNGSPEGSSESETGSDTFIETKGMSLSDCRTMGIVIENLQPRTNSEITPTGSLTSSACSSMVASVYEQTLQNSPTKRTLHVEDFSTSKQEKTHGETDDEIQAITETPKKQELYENSCGSVNSPFTHISADDLHEQKHSKYMEDSSDDSDLEIAPLSGDKSPRPQLEQSNTDTVVHSNIRFNYLDPTQVDHKLKLYLDMSVLKADEECCCILKSAIVQYPKPEEFEGFLLVTTEKIRIFKFVKNNKKDSEDLDDVLKSVEQQPITELQYADIGLGQQFVRLEFESACYTFLIRDAKRCQQFLKVFIGLIQASASKDKSKLQGIKKNNTSTLDNIKRYVIKDTAEFEASYDVVDDISQHNDEEGDEGEAMVKFMMGHLKMEDAGSRDTPCIQPVSIIIDPNYICLAYQDYTLPTPRLQTALEEKTKSTQFCLRDKQKIADIILVEVSSSEPNNINIDFSNEETSEECEWQITMETEAGVAALINAVKTPWENVMQVELEVIYS